MSQQTPPTLTTNAVLLQELRELYGKKAPAVSFEFFPPRRRRQRKNSGK